MSPVSVSENHQHYLFMCLKIKLTMLCIKNHYNKHYVFEIINFLLFIPVRIEYSYLRQINVCWVSYSIIINDIKMSLAQTWLKH